MIVVKDGKVEGAGDRTELMADFAHLVQMLVDKEVLTKQQLHEMVDMFGLSDKEIIKRKLIEEIDEMDNIGDALNLLGQVMTDRRLQ